LKSPNAVTCCRFRYGSNECFHFSANPLSGVLHTRVKTGPVMCDSASKYDRPSGSSTTAPPPSGDRLRDQ
jgi:hypothetical protein